MRSPGNGPPAASSQPLPKPGAAPCPSPRRTQSKPASLLREPARCRRDRCASVQPHGPAPTRSCPAGPTCARCRSPICSIPPPRAMPAPLPSCRERARRGKAQATRSRAKRSRLGMRWVSIHRGNGPRAAPRDGSVPAAGLMVGAEHGWMLSRAL